jgi:hypothetical protein
MREYWNHLLGYDRPINKDARTSAARMPGIFISYRRSDNPDAVGRIYDRLVSEFGKARVFKDVDSIPLGQDFRGHLNDIVGNCAAVLAIIGPKWTDVRSETGQRRLDDPDDFVRIELEAALERKVPVVPVLVGHAVMPATSQLPASHRWPSAKPWMCVRIRTSTTMQPGSCRRCAQSSIRMRQRWSRLRRSRSVRGRHGWRGSPRRRYLQRSRSRSRR